jgi:hypothetical protein
MSETPIADSIGNVNPVDPPAGAFQHQSDPTVAVDPEAQTSDNIPGANLGTGPWPNQEPVVDGLDEVSQDPNFVLNDKVTK